MMARETTEIRIDESGDETHESWLLVGAHHYTSNGTRLFDSEIPHQHFVGVTIRRCKRRRDLNHDRLFGEKLLARFDMSQAQWGAFVSSFGQGDGVPATLTFLTGEGAIPAAPVESRLEESHREVLACGEEAFAEIRAQYENVMEAFENGGKRALREELRSLRFSIENAPRNMEFAAESLSKHAENVVTKARADIEGMALAAVEQSELAKPVSVPLIERGGDHANN